ncbi:PucR family transcriptional regulator [Streptomyces fildesensis]|uniref:PucR family transcriptional regulator n=1 Tax=Streptomyces fildesensis TaxID=375757 RepID=A0ABW8C1B5_9ACTN
MHVDHLLQLESLDLTLLWGDAALLQQEISGVTATDLEDPARFLQPGEIVLSGLVWWSAEGGKAKADRFVSALRTSGAAALLAGEETHGEVPGHVLDACREQGIALLAVPARTNFRAITEAVYLRQWGDLSRRPSPHYLLPENVRHELSHLLAQDASPDELLDRAFAHLGDLPCYLVTATGRTIARTPAAPALPPHHLADSLRRDAGTSLRVNSETSPYDTWYLHLPTSEGAPPRLLHEIADVIAQHHDNLGRPRAAARSSADELVALLDAPGTDAPGLRAALRSCGLPVEGPFLVIAATLNSGRGDWAARALEEALGHAADGPFAVGHLPDGQAVAVAAIGAAPDGGPDGRARLAEVWPALHACSPRVAIHAGVSAPAATADALEGGLAQARFALTAARTTHPHGARVTATDDLTTLDALLAGIPAEVRAAYSSRILGPLAGHNNPPHNALLETLETFLAHNGSWARAAEALHLHVNTVHYRIQRIEGITGRDLSRLDHRLDLRAALLCR